MDEGKELEKLRYEIKVLKDTVSTLTKTIAELKTTVSREDLPESVESPETNYRIFQDSESCLSQDASWMRLMNLLQNTTSGLTATEAATRWGKSRSRTSEVLNRLVEEGHLVKYRDGRQIKFRTLED